MRPKRSDHPKRVLRAFDHYGIDPEAYGIGGIGGPWCDVCGNHPEASPRPQCDLEKARRAEIEALGFDCRTCAHCRKVYPKIIDQAALCPNCKRRSDERDARVLAELDRRPRRRLMTGHVGTVRVPDGLGCTERLPSWMNDPNYGRGE